MEKRDPTCPLSAQQKGRGLFRMAATQVLEPLGVAASLAPILAPPESGMPISGVGQGMLGSTVGKDSTPSLWTQLTPLILGAL